MLFDELKNGLAGAARGHGPVLLGLALRPRRLAHPRLPRPPGRAGAEPLLHRARGLARHLDHGDAARTAVARAAPPPELAVALDRLTAAVSEGGGGRAATQAMANLAEGIQGLVQHMRAEQQMIRDWVEAQAAREKELKQSSIVSPAKGSS